MSDMEFQPNQAPSLGVELELALVDQDSMGLVSKVQPILEQVPDRFANKIKPELMQCYLEINTGVCHSVAEVERDLHEKIFFVQQLADSLNTRLYWSGTHPFSYWSDQILTPDTRYESLIQLLQDMGRQLVTFGLHVHVGVDSGDKAVMICERLLRHLPILLALSVNSPWWENRITGLKSHRSKIMEALPTAGLPTLMRNWSEYVWLVKHLIDTGFINTIREIWWDVRPHHNFGTVEVRVCDMVGNLHDTLGIVALTQCLVVALNQSINEGMYQLDCHPMMARQNKWRASRYGTQAILVDEFTLETRTIPATVQSLVEKLRPIAEELNCVSYLERVIPLAEGPNWADKQLALYEDTGSLAEVVRRMTELSRLETAEASV